MTDLKIANGFVETDDSTYQFVKNLGEERFLLVQMETGDEEGLRSVYSMSVDVGNMSDEEISKALFCFYLPEELEEFRQTFMYGEKQEKEMACQVIAEAVFENALYMPSLMDNAVKNVSFETAKKVIQNFILTEVLEIPK